jgi:flavoprotein
MKRSGDRLRGLLESINREAGQGKVHCLLEGKGFKVVKDFRLLEEVELDDGDDLVEVVAKIQDDYEAVGA